MGHDKLLLRGYEYWKLFLHPQQYPYVGRSYAWLKPHKGREDVVSLSELTTPQIVELYHYVMKDWENALKNAFNPDKFNYGFLANRTSHTHQQMVPRYEDPRFVFNIPFIDPNFLGNWSPYKKKELDPEVIMSIRDVLLSHL